MFFAPVNKGLTFTKTHSGKKIRLPDVLNMVVVRHGYKRLKSLEGKTYATLIFWSLCDS